MAHITLSQLRTVLGRIVSWATSKFAARNVTSGKLEYEDMPVVVLASMGAELDGTGTDRPMSPGSTYFLPAGGGAGARIIFMDSQGVPAKISDPVSNVFYCNAYTNLLYRWDTAQAKMIPVGGTSSGSIDVSGKADLLTGANMLSPSQWPKVVLRNVTNTMLDDLVGGDVYFDTGNLFLHIDNQSDVSIGQPSKKTIYYCLADGKMYRWTGDSFEAVSLSVEQGKLLRLKTTVIVDEIKPNSSYDSLPSGKTEYIYYRAGDNKLVRMYLSGGSTVTEVYDPDPRVVYFNREKGRFMQFFNGQFHNALAIDDEPTEDSSNPVSSGGVYEKLATKQDKLSAGNGIVIAQDGKTVSVEESIRTGAAAGATAVQPGTLDVAMATKQNVLTFDNVPTAGSDNPVKSKGVKQAIDEKLSNVTVNAIPAGSVGIIDDCETDSATDALSARQGKELNDRLSEVEESGGMIAVFEGTKLVFRSSADLPMIRVSRGHINFPDTEETKSRTATFVVKGRNLTGGITLALTDASGMFSLSQNSISAANANGETTITVTYAPTAIGTHSASIALSSGETTTNITLNGTAIEEIIPTITLNGGEPINLYADSLSVGVKQIQVSAKYLAANEQVALASSVSDIVVSPATLTADENGRIDTTVELTYTAGSADVNGTLTASCTTIPTTTIAVAGHIGTRLAAGSYWDDGFFRYTVVDDNPYQLSVQKNPNATTTPNELFFPIYATDEGKTVYNSSGTQIQPSGLRYRVHRTGESGFTNLANVTRMYFDAKDDVNPTIGVPDGLGVIGRNTFKRTSIGVKCDIVFRRQVFIDEGGFAGINIGTLSALQVVKGNSDRANSNPPFRGTFDTLDFGEGVVKSGTETEVYLELWQSLTPTTGAKIISRRTTPPRTSNNLPSSWASVTLYVPDEAISAYQSHAEWGKITTIKGISELNES